MVNIWRNIYSFIKNERGSLVIEISLLSLIFIYSFFWMIGLVFFSYDIVSIQSDIGSYLYSSYNKIDNNEKDLSNSISRILLSTRISNVHIKEESISVKLVYNKLYERLLKEIINKDNYSVDWPINFNFNKTEYIRGKKYQN